MALGGHVITLVFADGETEAHRVRAKVPQLTEARREICQLTHSPGHFPWTSTAQVMCYGTPGFWNVLEKAPRRSVGKRRV